MLDGHIRTLAEDKPFATFGLDALNDILGGIYPGLNYAIGALPGSGKTTLLLQEADKLASDGHAVIFVSAELPEHKLIAKSLARLSGGGLAVSEVADAASPEHPKHEAFEQALERYRIAVAPNLCITGATNVANLGCLVGSCIHERRQTPIVFIDYLQILAAGPSIEASVDERVAIATCVKELRDISNCYGCPIFVLSTITRTAYGSKKPNLGVFGGSASVEYGFDAALYLVADDEKAKYPFNLDEGQRLKLVVLKNRYGSLSTAKLLFDGAHATFADAE